MRDQAPKWLQLWLRLSHAAVLVSLALLWLADGVSSVPATVWAACLAAPLLLAIPGVARGRRYTLQWLAIFLVIYIGALVVEVVALAGAWPAGMALGFAGLELGLLLAVLRRRDLSAFAESGES